MQAGCRRYIKAVSVLQCSAKSLQQPLFSCCSLSGCQMEPGGGQQQAAAAYGDAAQRQLSAFQTAQPRTDPADCRELTFQIVGDNRPVPVVGECVCTQLKLEQERRRLYPAGFVEIDGETAGIDSCPASPFQPNLSPEMRPLFRDGVIACQFVIFPSVIPADQPGRKPCPPQSRNKCGCKEFAVSLFPEKRNFSSASSPVGSSVDE